MKKFNILFLLVLIGFLGCTSEEEVVEECWRITFRDGTSTFEGLQVNGDPLPYQSFYMDEDNFSEVTDIKFYLHEDGTWNSKMKYTEMLQGSSSNKEVKRQGTYTCVSTDMTSYIYLVNTDGSEYGTFEWDESTDFRWMLRSDENEYLFIEDAMDSPYPYQ